MVKERLVWKLVNNENHLLKCIQYKWRKDFYNVVFSQNLKL